MGCESLPPPPPPVSNDPNGPSQSTFLSTHVMRTRPISAGPVITFEPLLPCLAVAPYRARGRGGPHPGVCQAPVGGGRALPCQRGTAAPRCPQEKACMYQLCRTRSSRCKWTTSPISTILPMPFSLSSVVHFFSFLGLQNFLPIFQISAISAACSIH